MQVLVLMQIADNLRAMQNRSVTSLQESAPDKPKYCGKFQAP